MHFVMVKVHHPQTSQYQLYDKQIHDHSMAQPEHKQNIRHIKYKWTHTRYNGVPADCGMAATGAEFR